MAKGKINQQYFKITAAHRPNHPSKFKYWLEFHTGTDREAVAQGKSLNQALAITDQAAPRFIEMLGHWNGQIKLHDLLPA